MRSGPTSTKTNVNGGSIAIGHPLGSTGVRLMTALLNELERTGGRYGLLTICEGGGTSNGTIIERLDQERRGHKARWGDPGENEARETNQEE